MRKTTKIILIVVVIVLLAFGIILAVYNHYKAEPMDANTENGNILDDANSGLENLINDILNEENAEGVENTEKSNNVENTQTVGTQGQNQPSTASNTLENQTTQGEKKAIELVKEEWKKEWGSLKDVSFNNVSIQGDGKYIVSVNDSITTNVIRRYVVDTATGLVEIKE